MYTTWHEAGCSINYLNILYVYNSIKSYQSRILQLLAVSCNIM